MKKLIVAVLVVVALAGSATAVYASSGDKDHHKYTAISVSNPNNPAQVSNKLVREKTPYAVYDQHITARLHERFGDAGGGLGSDVSETRRGVALRHDEDGVIHCALFPQG